MGSLRLKGGDCSLRFAGPTGPLLSINKIPDFEINILGEILTEEYTGEQTPDFDDISMGIEVKCTVHFNDPAIMDFFQAVEDRRRRATDPAGKFSAVGVFNFPSGTQRKYIVRDISWGNLPTKLASRKGFAATTLEGKASGLKIF